jgi:hypothetical protein
MAARGGAAAGDAGAATGVTSKSLIALIAAARPSAALVWLQGVCVESRPGERWCAIDDGSGIACGSWPASLGVAVRVGDLLMLAGRVARIDDDGRGVGRRFAPRVQLAVSKAVVLPPSAPHREPMWWAEVCDAHAS